MAVSKMRIRGAFSGIIYAEKFDEVEVIEVRVDISFCRNLRTGELFHCKNERIGTLAQAQLTTEIDTTKEKNIIKQGRHQKKSNADDKQQELFI